VHCIHPKCHQRSCRRVLTQQSMKPSSHYLSSVKGPPQPPLRFCTVRFGPQWIQTSPFQPLGYYMPICFLMRPSPHRTTYLPHATHPGPPGRPGQVMPNPSDMVPDFTFLGVDPLNGLRLPSAKGFHAASRSSSISSKS